MGFLDDSLGKLSFGLLSSDMLGGDIDTGAGELEAFLARQAQTAMPLIEAGGREAIGLTGQGLDAARGALSPFLGGQALQEQQALLGLGGQEAQAAAISGIPISPAQQQAQMRERRTAARGLAARGGAGGAGLLGLTQLGGAQQAQNIFNRLNQLGSLSSMNQAAAGQLSGLIEGAGARRAALEGDIGQQQAAILLGQVAPITQARTGAAQVGAAQTLAQQQQLSSLLGQGANFLGQQFSQPQPFSNSASGFGTVPGSQQTNMLLAQQRGLF